MRLPWMRRGALSSERTWVFSADSSACDLYFSEDAAIIGMPSSLEEETDGILNTCYNPIPGGNGMEARAGAG